MNVINVKQDKYEIAFLSHIKVTYAILNGCVNDCVVCGCVIYNVFNSSLVSFFLP